MNGPHPTGLFHAYRHGRLSASEAAEIERHLAVCADCRREYEGDQQLDTWLDGWQAPGPRPGFLTRLHDRLNEARPVRTRWSVFRIPVLSAALVLFVLGGVALWQWPRFVSRGVLSGATEALLADQLDFLDNLDLLQHWEMLEHWDEIEALRAANGRT